MSSPSGRLPDSTGSKEKRPPQTESQPPRRLQLKTSSHSGGASPYTHDLGSQQGVSRKTVPTLSSRPRGLPPLAQWSSLNYRIAQPEFSVPASSSQWSPSGTTTQPQISQDDPRPRQYFAREQGAKQKQSGRANGGRLTKHKTKRETHSAWSHGSPPPQKAQTTYSARSHGSPEQQTEITDTARKQELVQTAQRMWCQDVCKWFPELHSQTYFVPPLYFNKVPYDVEIIARQTVLVPHTASDQPSQAPVVVPPTGSHRRPPSPPLASLVWPGRPVPPGPLPVVYDMDVREDRSLKLVLNFLRYLADRGREVMLVVSQLEFRKYLDNRVDPLTIAAIHLLPRPFIPSPSYHGEFDVLIISRTYGLVLAEIKSVGADPSKTPDLVRAVVKVTEKAIKQLTKGAGVLRHLVSDLAPITVTKTLALPYITRTQLQRVLSLRPQLQQAIADCLGASDAADVACRCLCADDIASPTSSVWWQRAVTDHGPDSNMTEELYEILVARFCGPATTIEVPTMTTPRRTVELRTLSEGVALTGLTMSMLTLYPEQVDLLNRPGMPRVFLSGPPGTGKTVVLVLKALQWLNQGKDVHLLSSHKHSRAVTWLIEHQLKHVASGTAGTEILPLFYDFEDRETDVTAAVEKLKSCARDGELYVIADEALCYRGKNEMKTEETTTSPTCNRCRFPEFCTQLVDRVPSVHLWAASVASGSGISHPDYMKEPHLTTPIRSPPSVVREVEKCKWIDGKCVPLYTSRAAPFPTDGPPITWIQHTKSGSESSDVASGLLEDGHSGKTPAHCDRCTEAVVRFIEELRAGENLQYRDVFILCDKLSEDLPVVTRLLAKGFPVMVVTKEDETAIHDVALAVSDAVTVTTWKTVKGLERRVVVGMMSLDSDKKRAEDHQRLHGMSRSSSLLVWCK